jgi:hypothetical protein
VVVLSGRILTVHTDPLVARFASDGVALAGAGGTLER